VPAAFDQAHPLEEVSMKEIRTEVEIEAAAGRVWDVLADFDAYPEWNPFITAIKGVPEAGARLVVTIRAPGRKARDFRPRVLAAREGRELRWLGRLVMPGIFDGEHIHELEEVAPETTRYIQREKFGGILVPLLSGVLRDTERGFQAMAEALRQRAEAGSR
jgi:hypothetical protein